MAPERPFPAAYIDAQAAYRGLIASGLTRIALADDSAGGGLALVGTQLSKAAKRDFLIAGLSWGHMPVDLIAEDLVQGRLVELERRAWHLGPLVFVLSRMRGSELSPFEERAVQLLTGRATPSHPTKPKKARRTARKSSSKK